MIVEKFFRGILLLIITLVASFLVALLEEYITLFIFYKSYGINMWYSINYAFSELDISIVAFDSIIMSALIYPFFLTKYVVYTWKMMQKK